MLKNALTALVLIGLGYAARVLETSPTAHAQTQRSSAVLKKSWGPLRSGYTEPRTGELWLVFEDTAGTVRHARVYPGNGARPDCPTGSACVDLMQELTRE